MRRFHVLLLAVGLAAAPATAGAESRCDSSTPWMFDYLASLSTKPRLGVALTALTPELRTHFGAPDDRGVLVARVESGSPADAAGIAVGDVIVAVRGRKVESARDVVAAIGDAAGGQKVAIEIVRDHGKRTVEATLRRDGSPAPPAEWSGMRWLRELLHRDADQQTSAPLDDSWFREFHDLLHPSRPGAVSLRF